MKNKIKIISTCFALSALAISLNLTSCKKPEKGPAGPAGVAGPTGATGATGNANVIGTSTVTVNSWTASGNSWNATISTPDITQEIVDEGIVCVFVQYSTSWWSLPDINGGNSTQYGFGLGNVGLYNSNANGTAAPNPGPKTFRIVIVSPSNKSANPNVNWNNYSEVKKSLKLQD